LAGRGLQVALDWHRRPSPGRFSTHAAAPQEIRCRSMASPSGSSMRYGHTNLTARDWRRLADFYIAAFGCELVPPERDLSAEWLAKATGIPGAHLRGVHLRLPGHGPTGPTLEIFTYDST